ncbi:MAG: hypothetical protein KGL67_01315 [Patescibacteria group bacterium]|nr:hypothetical protein [Patescibacteria group bacterium]
MCDMYHVEDNDFPSKEIVLSAAEKEEAEIELKSGNNILEKDITPNNRGDAWGTPWIL